MSEAALEDYVTRVRPATASNILLWLIGGFFAIFVLWATFTKLDRTVRAQGKIIPSSQLQVVSNLEGGIVDAILVKTGDIVKRDAPLVQLDRTATGAEYGGQQSQYDALRARIARLEAVVGGRSPVYPVGGPGLAAQVAVERALYAAQVADLNSIVSASNARVIEAERAVTEADATVESRQSALGAARTELDLMRPLVDRGIEPRMTLVQDENAAAVAAGDYAAAVAAAARARSSVAEARATLVQQRQDWRSRTAQELSEAQGQMAALQRTLPALSAKMARTVVRTPVAGRVNRVHVTTIGGTVPPGGPIAEIVPSEDRLFVEALVKPADIGFVRISQPAKINVSAYNSAVYGSLQGKVVAISPDASVNEKTGESFYTVRVATGDKLRDSGGHVLEIGPGMTADVSLLGDKRSVMSYILTPLTRMSETAFREQ